MSTDTIEEVISLMPENELMFDKLAKVVLAALASFGASKAVEKVYDSVVISRRASTSN